MTEQARKKKRTRRPKRAPKEQTPPQGIPKTAIAALGIAGVVGLVLIIALLNSGSAPKESGVETEAKVTPTLESFPELLTEDVPKAIAFARDFDTANPDKIRDAVGLYEKILPVLDEDQRAPFLARLEQLNRALAEQHGVEFQKLENSVDGFIRAGQFDRALDTWSKAQSQFKDEDILTEIRAQIRDCRALQRRHKAILRCLNRAPTKLTRSSMKSFARELGPLLDQGGVLNETKAYKDLQALATRLKRSYRSRDKAQRLAKLKEIRARIKARARAKPGELKAREARAIEKSKDYSIPYKSGVRVVYLKENRFGIQFLKSGRERHYLFQSNPKLTDLVLQAASRPRSKEDLLERLCFNLQHQRFEIVKSLQKELVALDSETKAFQFDLEKLKRVGQAFRGEALPSKGDVEGARYDFQSKQSDAHLEDWHRGSKNITLSQSADKGITLTGSEIALTSESFHFQDEVSLSFPAPGENSTNCRVEIRLDYFDREEFYVAVDFNLKDKTYTLTRGANPLSLSPMTSMRPIRPKHDFRLYVKDKTVHLAHGQSAFSCGARSFSKCQVIIRHLDSGQVTPRTNWRSFEISGDLRYDWISKVETRRRKAIDERILQVQASAQIKKSGAHTQLSVDDPLSFAAASPAQISHYKRAWDLYREGLLQPALTEFSSLLRGRKQFAGAHFARGLIHEEMGDMDSALQNYESANKVDPLFPEALGAQALILARRSRTARAIEIANRALALHPDCPQALKALGMAAFAHRRFNDAYEHLEIAQEIAPSAQCLGDLRTVKHIHLGPPWIRSFEAKTDRFIVRTDVSQELANSTAKRLEDAQELYKKILGVGPKSKEPPQLCLVFQNQSDFHEYTKNTSRLYKHSYAGLYSSRYRSLMFYCPPTSAGPYYRYLEVLYHEGFHAYVDRVFDSVPTWLNEGLAQFSEGFLLRQVEKKSAVLSERLRNGLQSSAKSAISAKKRGHAPKIEELIKMGYHEFHNQNETTNYNYAALLLQFIRSRNQDSPVQVALKDYLQRLSKGEGWRMAQQRSFGDLDLKKLDKDVHKFIRDLEQR